MNAVLNIAAYKFVDLDDADVLHASLREQAESRSLRGTVLLAREGINLMLAGAAPSLRGFMAWLRTDARLADLSARESWSDTVPFARLRIKVKREIIRFGGSAVRPAGERAPVVDPARLARWLSAGHDDAGRPVAVLDTRNDFEVDHGAFVGAVDWRLRRFSDFPAALATHFTDLAGKTVVAYCTGGIRCEKAALLMRQAGLAHALQLDGGILGYFEQVSGAPHWRGSCFVFDQRTALDARMRPLAA